VGEFATGVRNADVAWQAFDSHDYWSKNYHVLLPEDRQIIHWVSEFLADHFAWNPPAATAVDVGAGTNLYPALLMLPWTDHVMLIDYAESNTEWLRHHACRTSGHWEWAPFWAELAHLPGYGDVPDPRARLAARHEVRRNDVFGLPVAEWELGTMFFVADAITGDFDEFREAVRAFLACLKPSAPFVATFMAGSEGYRVGDLNLPAVHVTRDSVAALFRELPAVGVEIKETDETELRVRPGYHNMILATGIVA